jgi:hypothetical protein
VKIAAGGIRDFARVLTRIVVIALDKVNDLLKVFGVNINGLIKSLIRFDRSLGEIGQSQERVNSSLDQSIGSARGASDAIDRAATSTDIAGSVAARTANQYLDLSSSLDRAASSATSAAGAISRANAASSGGGGRQRGGGGVRQAEGGLFGGSLFGGAASRSLSGTRGSVSLQGAVNELQDVAQQATEAGFLDLARRAREASQLQSNIDPLTGILRIGTVGGEGEAEAIRQELNRLISEAGAQQERFLQQFATQTQTQLESGVSAAQAAQSAAGQRPIVISFQVNAQDAGSFLSRPTQSQINRNFAQAIQQAIADG